MECDQRQCGLTYFFLVVQCMRYNAVGDVYTHTHLHMYIPLNVPEGRRHVPAHRPASPCVVSQGAVPAKHAHSACGALHHASACGALHHASACIACTALWAVAGTLRAVPRGQTDTHTHTHTQLRCAQFPAVRRAVPDRKPGP
jgi:hypothetical protein